MGSVLLKNTKIVSTLSMCAETHYTNNEAMQDQTKKESIQAVALWPCMYTRLVSSSLASMPSLPVLDDILGEYPICIVLIVAGDVALQRVHGSASSTVVH